jgi:hypothetical protein
MLSPRSSTTIEDVPQRRRIVAGIETWPPREMVLSFMRMTLVHDTLDVNVCLPTIQTSVWAEPSSSSAGSHAALERDGLGLLNDELRDRRSSR